MIAWVVAVVVALVRIVTSPRTIWELDECLFAAGVAKFDPMAHHPHPPGYPLTISLGKLVHFVVDDPFGSLVIVSILASAISAWALTVAFSRIASDSIVGAIGSLLFHLGPVMLVHGPLALSDPPAIMFLSLAVLMAERLISGHANVQNALLFGVYASASIGCRPQYAVAIVPFLFVVVFMAKREQVSKRKIALVAVASFTLTSLAWLIPLIVKLGGLMWFVNYELVQAKYVGARDAEVSRSGWSWSALAIRFIAHPWGPKWISLPFLAAAAAGLFISRRNRTLIALLVPAVLHIAFCWAVNDPADGVRYVLPALPIVAFCAALAVRPLRSASTKLAIGALLITAFSVYAMPILTPRTTTASPPVRAASWLEQQPPGIVGYVTSLKAHSDYLVGKHQSLPLDRAIIAASSSAKPLYAFVEGASMQPRAKTFDWPDSDAYGKITRNHYRVVSVVPIAREKRFSAARGLYPLERTTAGEEWRWLEQTAELRFRNLNGRTLRLRFGLSSDAPYQQVIVTLVMRGERRPLLVEKGAEREVQLPVEIGDQLLRIESDRSFAPAGLKTLNRDPRKLAVQLRDFELMR